jgi:hypothetical protein
VSLALRAAELPPFMVGVLSLSLMLIAAEVGFRIGRHIRSRVDERAAAQQHTLEASPLGLLSLLLGFSFAMAGSRFDLRKGLVIDEANAIGTASLRARVVPAPESEAIRQLLKGYVDERLALYRAGRATRQQERVSDERLERAWSLAGEVARRDPRSVAAGLLLQSLNEVIDLNSKRIAATLNHVPLVVLLVLVVVAAVSLGTFGVGTGFGNRRGLATTAILSLVIALITAVTIDLDQPKRGLIHISQDALLDMQGKLAAEPPALPPTP